MRPGACREAAAKSCAHNAMPGEGGRSVYFPARRARGEKGYRELLRSRLTARPAQSNRPENRRRQKYKGNRAGE